MFIMFIFERLHWQIDKDSITMLVSHICVSSEAQDLG